MNKSVIDTIMKPHRTRGESKYMVEEIYLVMCVEILFVKQNIVKV